MPCRTGWPQFSPFIFTKCSSCFINGFDTASFLLLVKSTKTTILPWSTILPTHSFGLQSVRRSPRLALLTLVMLIPRYLHNVGQNANKKTHGTSWDVKTECYVSDMFDIHWCRTWSMKSIITQIEIMIINHNPWILSILPPAIEKEPLKHQKPNHQSTKHWGIRLAKPNATCSGHPCWPITRCQRGEATIRTGPSNCEVLPSDMIRCETVLI